MGLPNLKINLKNGAMGRVAQTSDGVAGLILTGTAVSGSMELNKVYTLSSTRDLTTLGITEQNNPLVYKDVTAFYGKAGDGAELHLLVVAVSTTLTQMCTNEESSPINKLINSANGRIRLLGLNRLPADPYEPSTESTGIDNDAVTAAASLQDIANSFAAKINPFRAIIPALFWNEASEELFAPREASYNRVQFVMAADVKIGTTFSAAIGLAVGCYAAIPVHYSVARVKNGSVAPKGFLTNGKTPEENAAKLDALHDAGYLIYRTFVGRNGYYFNDDMTAAPLTDDYSSMSYGRVIDKAVLLTYDSFISEINETIDVDAEGKIPAPLCANYEIMINNAIAVGMKDEISAFSASIDPAQNILSSSLMEVNCTIVPKGTLREIHVNLGFENPALNQ